MEKETLVESGGKGHRNCHNLEVDSSGQIAIGDRDTCRYDLPQPAGIITASPLPTQNFNELLSRQTSSQSRVVSI